MNAEFDILIVVAEAAPEHGQPADMLGGIRYLHAEEELVPVIEVQLIDTYAVSYTHLDVYKRQVHIPAEPGDKDADSDRQDGPCHRNDSPCVQINTPFYTFIIE